MVINLHLISIEVVIEEVRVLTKMNVPKEVLSAAKAAAKLVKEKHERTYRGLVTDVERIAKEIREAPISKEQFVESMNEIEAYLASKVLL